MNTPEEPKARTLVARHTSNNVDMFSASQMLRLLLQSAKRCKWHYILPQRPSAQDAPSQRSGSL
eukprot:12830766-Prorocentrum_lima.AAC.1